MVRSCDEARMTLDSVVDYGSRVAVLDANCKAALMTKLENDSSALIPSGLVAILASTCCLNPFALLELGYSDALTKHGLAISKSRDTTSAAPIKHAGLESEPSLNIKRRASPWDMSYVSLPTKSA